MKAYTDYPFEFLGDVPGVEAPIREVFIHGWDNNKYVLISVGGEVTEIKAGYIYPTPARCGEVKSVDYKKYKVLSDEEYNQLWGE